MKNKTKVQNGEREKRNKISEILVKYNMPTRQVAINEIMQLLSQSKKEGRQEAIDEISSWEAMKDFEFLFNDYENELSKLTTK